MTWSMRLPEVRATIGPMRRRLKVVVLGGALLGLGTFGVWYGLGTDALAADRAAADRKKNHQSAADRAVVGRTIIVPPSTRPDDAPKPVAAPRHAVIQAPLPPPLPPHLTAAFQGRYVQFTYACTAEESALLEPGPVPGQPPPPMRCQGYMLVVAEEP